MSTRPKSGGTFGFDSSYPVDQLDEIAKRATELSADFDVWYSVCAFGGRPLKGRGTGKDVRWVPALWADVDLKVAVGLDLLTMLGGLPLPPSVVVATGHGYHAYWLFEEPYETESLEDREFVTNLNTRARQMLDAAAGARFDNVSDLARVLRLPGTTNHKKASNPKSVEICYATGQRYTVEQLNEALPALAAGSAHLGDVEDFARQGTLPRDQSQAVIDRYVPRYVERARGSEGRDNAGFALAQQLNDHYVPKDMAYEALLAYARAVPPYDSTTGEHEPFTEDMARAKVDSAYGYPPRGPAGHPKSELWLANPEQRTDDGNALLFARQHVGSVRYATDVKRWYAWDGQRWVPGADTVVLAHARETARSLGHHAADISDNVKQREALQHAKASLARSRIEAVPILARSDPSLAIKAGAFDSDDWLLNTPSGTVDLRTGQRREHRREDLNAKITRAPYDPAADVDYWLAWLDWASAGRPGWVEHLQRAVGYALTGTNGEQVFWLLCGSGANGKSTFLTVLEAVLGEYAWHAEADLLTPKDGASTTGVADLHGKRFVVATETKQGRWLDERQVKQLTGGDTITARRLYQDFFTFRPTHKIFFAINHLPKVTDTSPAFWRRVLLIPWDSTITEAEKRPDIAEWIIEHEAAGVLRWAVEGCLKWQRDGLMVPDYVRAKTQEYRQEEDALGAFLDACLVRKGDGWASTVDVWEAYKRWCSNEHVKPLGRNKFLDEVERRLGVTRGRRRWEQALLQGWLGVQQVKEDQ